MQVGGRPASPVSSLHAYPSQYDVNGLSQQMTQMNMACYPPTAQQYMPGVQQQAIPATVQQALPKQPGIPGTHPYGAPQQYLQQVPGQMAQQMPQQYPGQMTQQPQTTTINPATLLQVKSSTEPEMEVVGLNDALQKFPGYVHITRGVVYAKPPPSAADQPKQPANILMLMNENGSFTFPGGHLEKSDSSLVDGLNRELREEINMKKKMEMTQNNYLYSSVNHDQKTIGHIFAKEVHDQDFQMMVKRIPSAPGFGIEIMGSMVVPMYVLEDGFRGLPVFLSNEFETGDRHTLLSIIQLRQLMHPQQLQQLVTQSDQYIVR